MSPVPMPAKVMADVDDWLRICLGLDLTDEPR
jgi:hypothetical protein